MIHILVIVDGDLFQKLLSSLRKSERRPNKILRLNTNPKCVRNFLISLIKHTEKMIA